MSKRTERIIAVGETFDLVNVEFLDEEGKPSLKKADLIMMGFSNGEEFIVTPEEYLELSDHEFRIGPLIRH